VKLSELVKRIIEDILKTQHSHPLLVAIDGRDAAGKTILAKELADSLRVKGFFVIEASIDGFHNPREVRYIRGRESPEGYYRDSFNFKELRKQLLDPLKTGDLRYKSQAFDYMLDESVKSPQMKALPDSILVFDGIFTHSPELRAYWDYSIYLEISEEESLNRGINRDPGNVNEIRHMYNIRYLPGQRIYHLESDPKSYASIVVDNNDPNNPKIIS
jgi:uridine kinase